MKNNPHPKKTKGFVDAYTLYRRAHCRKPTSCCYGKNGTRTHKSKDNCLADSPITILASLLANYYKHSRKENPKFRHERLGEFFQRRLQHICPKAVSRRDLSNFKLRPPPNGGGLTKWEGDI